MSQPAALANLNIRVFTQSGSFSDIPHCPRQVCSCTESRRRPPTITAMAAHYRNQRTVDPAPAIRERSCGCPFNRSRDPRVVSAGAPPIRFFSLLKSYGVPPLARTRVKRRQTPAPTRAVSPVFRASSHPESSRAVMRLCRPALRAALKVCASRIAHSKPGFSHANTRRVAGEVYSGMSKSAQRFLMTMQADLANGGPLP
jgi:hypothetical protein